MGCKKAATLWEWEQVNVSNTFTSRRTDTVSVQANVYCHFLPLAINLLDFRNEVHKRFKKTKRIKGYHTLYLSQSAHVHVCIRSTIRVWHVGAFMLTNITGTIKSWHTCTMSLMASLWLIINLHKCSCEHISFNTTIFHLYISLSSMRSCVFCKMMNSGIFFF